MRRDHWLGALELVIGLGMLTAFVVVLLVPALVRLLFELPWAIGTPRVLPGFGIHPHWIAEVRYAPSLMMVGILAALAVCYRWLTSRRRS